MNLRKQLQNMGTSKYKDSREFHSKWLILMTLIKNFLPPGSVHLLCTIADSVEGTVGKKNKNKKNPNNKKNTIASQPQRQWENVSRFYAGKQRTMEGWMCQIDGKNFEQQCKCWGPWDTGLHSSTLFSPTSLLNS